MMDQKPNIYLFNPTCEYAVANQNENWQPNRILQKMESDLSLISLYLGNKNDYVLIDSLPSPEFIASLKQFNIEIPGFITKRESLQNQHFINLPKNKLLPWGWSPASHKLLSPLKKSCTSEFQNSPVYNWLPGHRDITSRKFALEILTRLQLTIKNDFILPAENKPRICTTQNDFEDAIKQWGKVMIKAPWSSSGRGLQPVTKTPVHPKVWEKVLGVVKEQGFALAEPLLNKVLDLALLFEIKKGKVNHLGNSYFYTNSKGQYEGNYLNGFPVTIDNAVLEFADYMVGEIRQPIINAIENSEMATFHEGYFGVDTLVYSDKNKLRINPCLEINVRYTMGLLALRLEKLISKSKKGVFSTYFVPGKTYFDFKNEMEVKHPLKIADNKIESGFFSLTDARTDSLFGAYILV
ncbi:MAG TPA: hypothetical protein PLC80_06330 [Draconibacterium sp.]|nr:hypothetical protein [Draconibacterium sp.]